MDTHWPSSALPESSRGPEVDTTGNAERAAAERREAPPAPGLPCLLVTTALSGCGEASGNEPPENRLQGGHKRSAQALALEVLALAERFGLGRLGFLTLTFAHNVQVLKEANRRFHSLDTHVIKGRYERAIAVPERQKSGRVHFHLLVVVGADIRSGADFEAFKRGDYRSASAALRSEWAFWRRTAPRFGFGRTELLPVKSTAEGIARYVGKYISKHVCARTAGDKGARLVRYLGYGAGDRAASCRFAWAWGNGWLWRRKLAAFGARMGLRDTDALARILGPRWAYWLQGVIMEERIDEVAPSRWAAVRALDTWARGLLRRYEVEEMRQGREFARWYDLKKG